MLPGKTLNVMECAVKCTAAELLEMRLPGLPGSKSALIARAKTEKWEYEEKTGVGGRRKVYTVPESYLGGELAVREQAAGYTTRPQAVDTLGRPVDVDEFVFIPHYDVSAAAGHGSTPLDSDPMFVMAFRKYWIINHLHADPKQLAVVSVTGESMHGVLNSGDVILINMADTQPVDGIYVVRVDGDLLVKHVQRAPDARLIFSSANPAYGSWTIDLAMPPTDFEVLGRVVWYARQM